MANAWSKEHLERTRDEITNLILQEVQPIASSWFENAHFHAHRWRFSRPINRPRIFKENRITFAGDAWAETIGTIEAALKSAESAYWNWFGNCIMHSRPNRLRCKQHSSRADCLDKHPKALIHAYGTWISAWLSESSTQI